MNNKPISLKEASRYLSYCENTGSFTWIGKYKTSNVNIGDVAGSIDGNGYRVIRLMDSIYQAHRLVFLFVGDTLPDAKLEVDHINGNKDDNRYCNLRLVTRSQNQMNRKTNINNKSGMRGVSWKKVYNKWCVQLGYQSKLYFYGYYSDLDEAKEVASKARKELHGEYYNER